VGQYVVTVGLDYYYLLYEVKVAAFNRMGLGPVSPDGVYVYSAEGRTLRHNILQFFCVREHFLLK